MERCIQAVLLAARTIPFPGGSADGSADGRAGAHALSHLYVGTPQLVSAISPPSKHHKALTRLQVYRGARLCSSRDPSLTGLWRGGGGGSDASSRPPPLLLAWILA